MPKKNCELEVCYITLQNVPQCRTITHIALQKSQIPSECMAHLLVIAQSKHSDVDERVSDILAMSLVSIVLRHQLI